MGAFLNINSGVITTQATRMHARLTIVKRGVADSDLQILDPNLVLVNRWAWAGQQSYL